MSVRVEFRWKEDFLARVDAAVPEGVSRATWVRWAVERALEGDARGTPASQGVDPAPAEQPDPGAAIEVLRQAERDWPRPLSRAEMFRKATQR